MGKDQALSLHACIVSFQNLKAVTYFGQGSLPVTAKFNSKVVLLIVNLIVKSRFFKVCVAVNQYFLL